MSRVIIPEPSLSTPAPDLWRIAATIDGVEIYIESNRPLVARAESFACLLLLSAMERRRSLTCRGAMTAEMTRNLDTVQSLALSWWPERLHAVTVRTITRAAPPPAPGRGLFFSGGVDSFFALKQLLPNLTELVSVEWLGIRRDDPERLREGRERLLRASRAVNLPLTLVRTNLRTHPLFRRLHWEITHIAALASIAHALEERIGTMHVASTDCAPPYGSHPDLDKLWSSGPVSLINVGSEFSRLQRVEALRDWSPIQGNLRVCWQHLAPTHNCGICEKCVRTRLECLAAGDADAARSFPDVPLATTLSKVKRIPEDLFCQWHDLQSALPHDPWTSLIDDLLRRSHPPLPPPPPTLPQRLHHLVGRSTRCLEALFRPARQGPAP